MIFGKYQLLELLGRGGMAEVFKAKSYGVEGFEKLLVIKRILPNFTNNARFVELLINEAKIAVSLNHANIVQVFDLGKVVDSYYIAMEYVQGLDLANMLKLCRRLHHSLPIELTAFVGSEIAKGLDYAHRKRDQHLEPLNIIHRDISPHNILVSFEGEVKITDFGIAKAKITLDEKEAKIIKGKHAYMAPEQARGKPHDRRVDIFSLGVMLYEMIAGRNPFRGEPSADILRRIKTKAYPTLRQLELEQEIPEKLEEIVNRAMDPDPDKRFADAGEMYEWLIAFLYSTGARVGAHTLSTFLDEIQQGAKDAPVDSERAELAMAFGAGSGPSSVSALSATGDSTSDITSVQVPSGTKTDEKSTTTGSSSISAELRDVTLLAVEFAGPTPSNEIVDRLSQVILQNGGTLIESRNDLLLGLFGVELTDGRDTQDAIDTGLKLQRTAIMNQEGDVVSQLGVGVYPEKLVIQAEGGPREDDTYFEAVAKTRDLAKSAIGWVLTPNSGRQLTGDSHHFEEFVISTGRKVEQVLYKVIGRRPVTETYGRMFGRRQELRLIGETLAVASRGSGRVLAVTGEAGIGKTRIIHEVQRRLLSGGHAIGWYEATCPPWRHATSFAAIDAMFRSILGIGDIEPLAELKNKAIRLRELGLIPEEVEAVSVLLGMAQEREVGPEERARQLRSATIRALSSLAQDKLTIFFWDGLSHIDHESLDILRHLSRSIDHLSALLAFSFRQDFDHGFDKNANYLEFNLGPLSEVDSKRLALSRIRARKAPEDLLIDIALKSGGNPQFTEEYVKALLANNVITVSAGKVIYNQDASLADLPKTLRGLVGTRIKHLPVTHRSVLQRAAVMGQRFNVELLSQVTGVEVVELKPIIRRLIDANLLTRISTAEFKFSSDITRDVVYNGIVFSDRREIHVTVARSIESMFIERLDEFVERLAIHYREGGDRDKAVEYLIRAGKKVASDYSHSAALNHYLKALDLLHNVPHPDTKRICELYVDIGELAIKANMLNLGLDKMMLAEQLAVELDDNRTLVQIMRITAELHVRASHYAESQQYFQRAIELADEMGDQELRCKVRATAGDAYDWVGDLEKSAQYYQEAIDIWSETDDQDLLIRSMAYLSKAQANSGEPQQAFETLAEAKALITAETDPITRCIVERCSAAPHYMLHDFDAYNLASQKALEIAKEYDIKDQIAANAHNIGDSYLALGDYAKAFFYFKMSQEVGETLGLELFINLNSIFLAFIDALNFGSNEGLAQLEKALATANEQNAVWEQIQVYYFLGRIHFERKQYDLAKPNLEQSVKIGRATNNRIYEAQAQDVLEQIKEING